MTDGGPRDGSDLPAARSEQVAPDVPAADTQSAAQAAIPAEVAAADGAATPAPAVVAPLADAMAGGSAPADAAPPLEPVDPGLVHAVSVEVAPVVPGGTGRIGRIGGYLLAAIAGGALVLVALAATGMVGGPRGQTTDASTAATASTGAAPSTAPSSSTGAALASSGFGAAPVLGDPGAPVLVEMWADYQCPYCGVMTHAIEPAIVRELVDSGRVRFAYRDFAFLGQESVDAAAAARCAGRQDAYWSYHDLLFASQRGENQGTFSPTNLLQVAGFAGLDQGPFASCMDGREAHAAVLADTEAGRALGISSTPTLHIVGPKGSTFIKGVSPLAAIEKAIQQTIDGTVPSPTPEPAPSGISTPGSSPAATASPAP